MSVENTSSRPDQQRYDELAQKRAALYEEVETIDIEMVDLVRTGRADDGGPELDEDTAELPGENYKTVSRRHDRLMISGFVLPQQLVGNADDDAIRRTVRIADALLDELDRTSQPKA
jgi:hypothetical protein